MEVKQVKILKDQDYYEVYLMDEPYILADVISYEYEKEGVQIRPSGCGAPMIPIDQAFKFDGVPDVSRTSEASVEVKK